MPSYTFERIADGATIPIGEWENDAMALALLGREEGGSFTTNGDGDPEYLMRRAESDGHGSSWGQADIPVYRR